MYRPIALVKKYCTETAQETAKDAVQVSFKSLCSLKFMSNFPQIFGGRGLTKTGMLY
jgi:hypothetical protein